MQPYFFPYLGYFQLINAVDEFILLDDVTYIKGGWINRNHILSKDKPELITVPLHKLSSNKLICETVIADHLNWRNKFLKTIHFNYKKAPFFDDFFPLIENVIQTNISKINEMNYYALERIVDYIGIDTMLKKTSYVYNNNHLKAQERIIDICIQENTSTYLNSVGGQSLYNKALFEKENIDLKFIVPKFPKYPQFNSPFVSSLSIIDILMFNSPFETRKMLLDYELK